MQISLEHIQLVALLDLYMSIKRQLWFLIVLFQGKSVVVMLLEGLQEEYGILSNIRVRRRFRIVELTVLLKLLVRF